MLIFQLRTNCRVISSSIKILPRILILSYLPIQFHANFIVNDKAAVVIKFLPANTYRITMDYDGLPTMRCQRMSAIVCLFVVFFCCSVLPSLTFSCELILLLQPTCQYLLIYNSIRDSNYNGQWTADYMTIYWKILRVRPFAK
jgi:hypothetical protein